MTNYSLDATTGAVTIYGSNVSQTGSSVVSDTVSVTSVPSEALVAIGKIAETIGITSSEAEAAIFNLTQGEHVSLQSLATVGFQATISDHVTISEVVKGVLALTILERLKVVDAATSNAIFLKALSDAVKVSGVLGALLSGDITEHVILTDTRQYTYTVVINHTDAIALSESLGTQLLMSITMNEGINLTEEQVLQGIFENTIEDDIVVTAGYLAPDGTYTTWAINTRTNAVTEYQNWVFNSFAKMGRKYIAASRDGLYELDGVDDDGASIPAYIGSGLFSPGQSRYSSFKAAYIGMRVKDDAKDFFLKLVTGNGTEYMYQFKMQNMHTTRVNFGKGLRSRWYAWELVTNGAEFELDSVTFIPLVAQRRVG